MTREEALKIWLPVILMGVEKMPECKEALEMAIKALEQEPKGKWITIQSGDKDFPQSIVCSRCKNENSHFDFDEHSEPIGKIFVTSKYCPNCGAEMSEIPTGSESEG